MRTSIEIYAETYASISASISTSTGSSRGPVTDQDPAEKAAIWRAWVQRGTMRQPNPARGIRMLAGSISMLVACGTAFYLLAMR